MNSHRDSHDTSPHQLLVISACSAEKQYDGDLTCGDLDSTPRIDLIERYPDRVASASEMYTGAEHTQVSTAVDALREIATVDWHIVSAGFGLLSATTPIVPYECTLSEATNDKCDFIERATRLGIDAEDLTTRELLAEIGRAKSIPADLAALDIASYDAVFIVLGTEYLQAIQGALEIVPPSATVFVFAPKSSATLIGASELIPAGEDERDLLGVPMTRLKGTQFRNLATSLDSPRELTRTLTDTGEIYQRAMDDSSASRTDPTDREVTTDSEGRARSDESLVSGKYGPLTEYLDQQQESSVELSFDDLEAIIEAPLPNSAYEHTSWWANSRSHSQATAWLQAGWTVESYDLETEEVRFDATENASVHPESSNELTQSTITTGDTSRGDDVDRFYELLAQLESVVGGRRQLGECDGYMDWPDRGLYIFFAPDEQREATDQQRVTRVGTHAVSSGSSATLWSRLRTHRGAMTGSYADGGNHRGSVFRRRVGEAMLNRDNMQDTYPEWGVGSSAKREQRLAELEHEQRVSEFIRDLPFLWVAIDDEPGPSSDRSYIERNAIALLSNYERPAIDPREDSWLGAESPSAKIRSSGLWNIDHVDEEYDPEFLDRFEHWIEHTQSR